MAKIGKWLKIIGWYIYFDAQTTPFTVGSPTILAVDLKITIQAKEPNIHARVDLSSWLQTVLKWPKAKLLNLNTILNDYRQTKNYLY